MSKPIQTAEELDAVLHWRRKHAQAMRAVDAGKDREAALQQRLTAADERVDHLESGIKWEAERNALLLASLTEAEDMLSVTSLEAGQRMDVLEELLQRAYDADLAARHHQPYNVSKLMDEIEAALKPAQEKQE